MLQLLLTCEQLAEKVNVIYRQKDAKHEIHLRGSHVKNRKLIREQAETLAAVSPTILSLHPPIFLYVETQVQRY